MEFLEPSFWMDCQSRYSVKQKINENLCQINDENILDLLLLTLYIRDKSHGLGNKNISRWMLIELETEFPGFCSSVLENLPKFGYWKDLNLILIDIFGNSRLEYFEKSIIKIIKNQFKLDQYYLESHQYDKMSNLCKYIGKERKSLDKKTGFTRKIVPQIYPDLELFESLKKFRIICKKINKIKRKEKNNFNSKMNLNKRKYTNIKQDLVEIKKNIWQYPKYWDARVNFKNNFINSSEDIRKTNKRIKKGSYFYDKNLINSLDENDDKSIDKSVDESVKSRDIFEDEIESDNDDRNSFIDEIDDLLDYSSNENIDFYIDIDDEEYNSDDYFNDDFSNFPHINKGVYDPYLDNDFDNLQFDNQQFDPYPVKDINNESQNYIENLFLDLTTPVNTGFTNTEPLVKPIPLWDFTNPVNVSSTFPNSNIYLDLSKASISRPTINNLVDSYILKEKKNQLKSIVNLYEDNKILDLRVESAIKIQRSYRKKLSLKKKNVMEATKLAIELSKKNIKEAISQVEKTLRVIKSKKHNSDILVTDPIINVTKSELPVANSETHTNSKILVNPTINIKTNEKLKNNDQTNQENKKSGKSWIDYLFGKNEDTIDIDNKDTIEDDFVLVEIK